MATVYMGRCASVKCSGGTSCSAYVLKRPEQYEIPTGIWQRIPDDDVVGYCGWCHFVWTQPRFVKLGAEAVALGYVEEVDGRRVFKENRHVPIRDWKANLKHSPKRVHSSSDRRSRR